GQRADQPVMRVGGLCHLRVLLLGGQAVFGDLAPCAVFLELGSAFLDASGAPEARTQIAALLQDLALLEPLGEQDEERTERHDTQDDDGGLGDEAALLKRFLEAELVLRGCVRGSGKKVNKHAIVLSRIRWVSGRAWAGPEK